MLIVMAATLGPVKSMATEAFLDDTGDLERWGRLVEASATGGLKWLAAYLNPDNPSPFKVPVEAMFDLGSRSLNIRQLESTVGSTASGSGLNISRDGNTGVGYIDKGFFTPYHAFRWTEATGIVDLGTLDPPNNATKSSYAHDVSSDGSLIVGYSSTASGSEHAFRWTPSGGMVDLDPGGSALSRAYGVSGDGSVIVGAQGLEAVRWTEAGGVQSLGSSTRFASAVTADGLVAVGQTRLFPPQAFRWTQASGAETLGVLPGHTQSMATGVSDDGSIVVGVSSSGSVGRDGVGGTFSFDPAASRAFYWTAADGMQDLTQLLADAGADLDGSTLVAATGISPDGAWIGGAARKPTTPSGETIAFLASLTVTLPDANFNKVGGVDAADLAIWRSGFGASAMATQMQGDADGDGDVDGRDFLIWQRQFGSAPAIAAGTAVPEPTVGLLFALALASGGIQVCRQSFAPVQ